MTITAFVEQNDALAGETDYLDENTVSTDAAGDRRPAAAGELTFVVVDSATNTPLDQGSTDSDGIVVLDAELDVPFFVYEVSEPDDGVYGSPDITLTGDETVDLQVTRYVAVQQESAAPSATASGSATASSSPLATPSGTASLTLSVAPSDDGTGMPSTAPAASTTGTSVLPNTGSGPGASESVPGAVLWLTLLAVALALVGAIGVRVRRL